MSKRILCWGLSWVTFSIYLIWQAIAMSKANLENDPSSGAWIGFLPFIFPLFFLEAGKWLLPVATSTEVIFWLYDRKQSKVERSQHCNEDAG